MNTRSSHLRRLASVLGLALSYLIAGCDFGHPYGEPSGAAINPALLGTWIDADPEPGKNPSVLEVTARSESEFLVKYVTHTFLACRVPETPDNFLQMRLHGPNHEPSLNDPSARTYIFCFFSFENDTLVVRRISEPEEKAPQPASSAAVRAWVGRAVQGETYLAQTYRFVRRPRSSDALAP